MPPVRLRLSVPRRSPCATAVPGAAHRHLGAAGVELAEHQRRDVDASDEQDDAHGDEQRQEGRPHLAEEALAQRREHGVLGEVPLGEEVEALVEEARDGSELRAHRLDALAGWEARDDAVVADVVLRVHRLAEPDPYAGVGEPEAFGHHADDGAPLSRELDALADDRGAGAELAPKRVAEDGDGLGADAVVAAAEPGAQCRAHAEHVEELGARREAREQARRGVADAQRGVGRPDRRRALEAVHHRPHREELLLGPGALEPEGDDLLLGAFRQRVEEQAPRDAVHRRRAGDAEGEGEHGERRVGAAAEQPAQGEPDVDGEALEHRFSLLKALRRGLEGGTEKPPGGYGVPPAPLVTWID